MKKFSLIFALASVLILPACGDDDSGSGTPQANKCPETCPDGQVCDESTNFKCVDKTEETKKCPATCPDGQSCSAETNFECVKKADETKKCPDTCPDGQICSAETNFECVKKADETKKCPEPCPDGQSCSAETNFECVKKADETKKCPEPCPDGQICSAETNFECVKKADETKKCPAKCAEDETCGPETNYECTKKQQGDPELMIVEAPTCEGVTGTKGLCQKTTNGDYYFVQCFESGKNEFENCTKEGSICIDDKGSKHCGCTKNEDCTSKKCNMETNYCEQEKPDTPTSIYDPKLCKGIEAAGVCTIIDGVHHRVWCVDGEVQEDEGGTYPCPGTQVCQLDTAGSAECI